MARIRTVKPEFWRHPIMARLDDDFQLLALAILSMADDHGYFRAEPELVRGDVQPFRESLARLSEGLQRLSEVEWIELRFHENQGKIGHVCNWELHQKVDHPSPSKLKGYFLTMDSREPREKLALEQGTGNREHDIKKNPASKRSKPTENLGEYPPELLEAVSDWRALLKTLKSSDVSEAYPPEKRFLPSGPGTNEATWKAWQKRKAALVKGHQVKDADLLEAVRLWASTKLQIARKGDGLAASMLPTLINSDGFVDALVRAVETRIAQETCDVAS